MSKLQIGDWVLVYFPHDETGKLTMLYAPTELYQKMILMSL